VIGGVKASGGHAAGGRRAVATTWRGERDTEGGEALPGSGAGQGFAMASRTSREGRRQAPRGQAAVGWRSFGLGGLRVSTPVAASWRRIFLITGSSVMNAIMRIGPAQRGQTRIPFIP
jgi:hypothetical protein